MTWMVDLEILVDVLENDAENGRASAAMLDKYRQYGELYISPVTYVQLGPLFTGLRELQDKFLASLGVAVAHKQPSDTLGLMHAAWCHYVRTSRGQGTSEMPFVRLLIGAQALAHDGFLTRRPEAFTQFFPKLRCVTPSDASVPAARKGVAA